MQLFLARPSCWTVGDWVGETMQPKEFVLQKLPPLQTWLSESSGIRGELSGVMPGPVVRQSVMGTTSMCFLLLQRPQPFSQGHHLSIRFPCLYLRSLFLRSYKISLRINLFLVESLPSLSKQCSDLHNVFPILLNLHGFNSGWIEFWKICILWSAFMLLSCWTNVIHC